MNLRASETADTVLSTRVAVDPYPETLFGATLEPARARALQGHLARKRAHELDVMGHAKNEQEKWKLAKPVASSIAEAMGQLIKQQQVMGERVDSAIPVLEFGLHQAKQLKFRLMPSENPGHKGRINSVEVKTPSGEVRRFRRLVPSELSEQERDLWVANFKMQIKQQIGQQNATMGIVPQHEKWLAQIEARENVVLWLPVGSTPGATGILRLKRADLPNYVGQALAKMYEPDQLQILKQRYSGTEGVWGEITAEAAEWKMAAERVRAAYSKIGVIARSPDHNL